MQSIVHWMRNEGWRFIVYKTEKSSKKMIRVKEGKDSLGSFQEILANWLQVQAEMRVMTQKVGTLS